MNDKQKILLEYAKCVEDPLHAIEGYLETLDTTQNGYVPFKLFDGQQKLIHNIINDRFNLVRKYRQAGISTVTAALSSALMVFGDRNNPEKVLILANKQDTSINVLSKIMEFIGQYPSWANVQYVKNSARHIKLANGAEAKAVATSLDALRGYTPTLLILDEAAFIEGGQELWSACLASVGCLDEETYIYSNTGIIQLKDIIEDTTNLGFHNLTKNISVYNQHNQLEQPSQGYKSEKTQMFRVKTRFGHELKMSWKHPLMLENGEWEKVINLKIGDSIKFGYNLQAFGENDIIKLNKTDFSKNTEYFGDELNLSENLDISYLMGLFIAEGNFNKDTIAITCGDDEIRDRLLSDGYGTKPFKESKKHHYYMCSKYYSELFKTFGITHSSHASEKRIPKQLFTASKPVISAFLSGLFDGDGCITKNKLKLSTTSKLLADQVQTILLNFGIRTRIQYSEQKTSPSSIIKNKEHITKIYDVYILSSHINKFLTEIGFKLTRKQELIKYYQNKRNLTKINVTKDEVKQILSENNISSKEYEAKYRFFDSAKRYNKGFLTKYALEQGINLNITGTTFNEIINRWEFNNNYFYDEIIEIEEYTGWSYDLHLPKTHSFNSNGFISHNTGGKVVLISTPNGMDEIYYAAYDSAVNGRNSFIITDLKWWDDPRYNKNLIMVQTKDIIDYLQLAPEEREKVLTMVMKPQDVPKYMELGWKPLSPWYEKMARDMNLNRRMVAQELEGAFNGSGDNVIDTETIMKQSRENVKNPDIKDKGWDNQMWIWELPKPGHRYILACLPPGEKVITNNGLKNIEDVDYHDKLINEKGDLVKIKNKQIYETKDEDVYEISVDNTFRTTKFTSEHPILISKPILKRNYKQNHDSYQFNERYWDFDFNFVEAKNVLINDWIKVPNIYKREKNIDSKYWDKYNNQSKTDFRINNPMNNKNFWWLVGLWLGDGYCHQSKSNKHSYTINFTLNTKETEYINKLILVINQLFNRTPTITITKKNVTVITFTSKILYQFLFENFDFGALNKKIPEWVKYLPKEFKYNLILGYFNSGSGSITKVTKNNKTYFKTSFVSISLELLEGYQDILFSLGIISNLKLLIHEKEYKLDGHIGIQKETYSLNLSNYDSIKFFEYFNFNEYKLNRINFTPNVINKRTIKNCHLSDDSEFIYFKITNINKTNYSGLVYNFECDTNTFMCHHITTHNCDVSRGDSDDYTGMVIVDFDTWEEVAEYMGRIPPDDAANLVYHYGKMYNALSTVDITGGMGMATALKLIEMEYPTKLLHFDGLKDTELFGGPPKGAVPGINFASKNRRALIVQALEEAVRQDFKVRSERMILEMNKFIYKNGKPDHMKGAHDDLLMSLGMCIYVANTAFKRLEASSEQLKSMLSSWKVSNNVMERPSETLKPTQSIYENNKPKTDRSMELMEKMAGNPNMNDPNLQNYIDNSWLFGNFMKKKQ